MELRIINPQEEGFVQEIQWNHEELKTEISRKMQDYKTLVFTEDTTRDAKKDRADLNKLKKAFDDERKRIKKLCMAPYEKFEQQAKEIIALIDEPIRMIDAQIKEVEEQKKIQKRKEIEALFDTIGFHVFVTLDSIWDEKWLNATFSMSKIEEQMRSRMYQIGTEVLTIQQLPEFSFEAMEVYKNTLNLSMAIQEGQRLADIQKRKKEHEEACARQKAEEEARKAMAASEHPSVDAANPSVPDEKVTEGRDSEPVQEAASAEVIQLDFRVWGTREQLMALRNYMVENGLKYGKVE